MNALITGIAGFVGGHLAEHLLCEGDRVVGTALSSRWPTGTPPQLVSEVPLVAWDVTSDPSASLLEAAEALSPDCLFHMAAISVPRECGDVMPTPTAEAINVDGALRRAISGGTAVTAASCWPAVATFTHRSRQKVQW
ncbi:MAG: NAD(P)-dependent oxidoreductase [Pirellulales bacterium]